MIYGFAFKRTRIEEGEFKWKDILSFNLYQVVGNVIAWLIIAPVLDIVIYAEPSNLVFTQGAVACLMNIIAAGVIGTLLCVAYSATRPKKGSLSQKS